MPTKADVKYLAINDFSPGIRADYRLNTGIGTLPAVLDASKPGEAMFTGTYALPSDQGGGTQAFYTRGYYANDQGKLVPLPILRWDTPAALLPALGTDTFLDVAGFEAIPGVISGTPTDEFWAWVHTNASPAKDTMRVYRGSTLIKTMQGTIAGAGPPRGITHILSRGKRSGFGSPAGPELFWEWTSGEPHTDGSVQFYDVFPDPSNPNLDTPDYEETATIANATFVLGGQILAHNGRIIRLCEQADNFGTHKFWANERIRNTDPPNSVSLTSTTTDSIIDPQNPSGYGAWGSLTYGELFLVKNYGGAILIEGDVYAPQITRLPGVQSTGSHMSETAACAGGLVYMTDDGPYLWEGGATSHRLGFPAGAIIPMFANMPGNGGSGITCSVTQFNNLIIFSGGAVYDSIHGNWWALEVPYSSIPISFFSASPYNQGRLYGITNGIGTSGHIEVYNWLPSQITGHLAQASWLSQPIPVNYDTIDIVSVEVSLGAMPSDVADVVVAISFVTIDGQMRFCGNFTPNPSNPDGAWRFRTSVGIRARDIQPYILVFNNNGNIPSINEIVIGYQEAGHFGHGTQVN